MDPQTQNLLITLLVLLIVILQFFLRQGAQSDAVKELETRLAEVEQRLEEILLSLGP